MLLVLVVMVQKFWLIQTILQQIKSGFIMLQNNLSHYITNHLH
eukprot:UN07216